MNIFKKGDLSFVWVKYVIQNFSALLALLITSVCDDNVKQPRRAKLYNLFLRCYHLWS